MTYRDIEANPSRRDEQGIPGLAIVAALILVAVVITVPMVFPDTLATILLAGASAIPVLLVLSIFSV